MTNTKNEIPNFDNMTINQMLEWLTGNWHPKSVFPNKPKGYQGTHKWIVKYVRNKIKAMIERTRGNITVVILYEDTCDRIYSRLPEYARW